MHREPRDAMSACSLCVYECIHSQVRDARTLRVCARTRAPIFKCPAYNPKLEHVDTTMRAHAQTVHSSKGSSRSRATPARHLACGIYCAHVHYVRAPRARTLSYLSAQTRTLAVDCVRVFFVVVHCETAASPATERDPAREPPKPKPQAMRRCGIRSARIKSK